MMACCLYESKSSCQCEDICLPSEGKPLPWKLCCLCKWCARHEVVLLAALLVKEQRIRGRERHCYTRSRRNKTRLQRTNYGVVCCLPVSNGIPINIVICLSQRYYANVSAHTRKTRPDGSGDHTDLLCGCPVSLHVHNISCSSIALIWIVKKINSFRGPRMVHTSKAQSLPKFQSL